MLLLLLLLLLKVSHEEVSHIHEQESRGFRLSQTQVVSELLPTMDSNRSRLVGIMDDVVMRQVTRHTEVPVIRRLVLHAMEEVGGGNGL